MAKRTKNDSDTEKRRQAERALLDSWHPHIEKAIYNLYMKFIADTKFILTESDLKCWLFYYLQQERPYTPFAVHTEVTHYAEHTEKDKKTKKEKTEKKYRFRDLSLLCPSEIKANEEFLEQGKAIKKLLSKGFQHNASAIHFELKFIRVNGDNNQTEKLKSDIDKLRLYSVNNENHIRDFIIVCGTRNVVQTNLADLKKLVEDEISQHATYEIKHRLQFYLFDAKDMFCLKWNGKAWNENTFKKAY